MRIVKISQIKAHKVLNSRGSWTIEAKVTLDDGSVGVETVPEGASKGKNEAVSLPAEKAVDIVNKIISPVLKGENPFDQKRLDSILIEMDGTKNKSKLGGNSILSVSLAVCKAAAVSQKIPLYNYVSEMYGTDVLNEEFPTPVFNILNGGKHADNNLSFQEFMVIPAREKPIYEALEMGVEIYHSLEKSLKKAGFETGVGDEGGFAPEGFTVPSALEFIKQAVGSKYKMGEDVFLGMDIAADSFKHAFKYVIKEEDLRLNADKLFDYYEELIKDFPLIYMEDPFHETDYKGWEKFYGRYSRKLMVVADDLVVTNVKILQEAIDKRLANAVIVKPNQIGTLTETLDFIKLAQDNDMRVIVSHRSGDTAEDTFIADLAVAVGADYIKSGAPARGERVAKYNRLLEIFEETK